MTWHCATYEFDERMPIVMGILNVTPDSFSDGGQHNALDAALEHAHRMLNEGAAIIDVGGESTRPGSDEVSIGEEIDRVIDVVRVLSDEGVCVSIDTRHSEVARAAIDMGASIINDVSGFRDPAMVKVATECDAGLVVMHMKGEPKTMQNDPQYEDVVAEVRDYLRNRAAELEAAGIAHDRICIDPGPGFGKTPSQTLEMVRNYHEFARLGYPLMAAFSRKSFIGYAYHIDNPAERDAASAAEALLACELGASVVRTHNVAMTVEALKDLRPLVVLSLGCNIALVGNRIFGLLACDDDKSLGYRKTPVFNPHSTRIKELYADCMPVNLVFINNIMPETPHFADLAADPCRREDNWLVPRTCWKVDEADGNCTIEPTADLPRPDFKPVTAERLGTGLFTGEEFPLPDTELSTPNGSNACTSL